jgi:hypothetical protein
MINASEANFKSKYQKQINEILKGIERNINEAISDGEFQCQFGLPVDTTQEVRDEIEKQMQSFGYNITIPKKTTYYGPCDQAPWYDYINISWDKN